MEIFRGRAAASSQLAAHIAGGALIGAGIGLTIYAATGLAERGPSLRNVGFALAALLAVAGIFLLARAMVRVASLRYRIDDTRIEIERGILRRKIDNLELWRVKDIRFRQGLIARMLDQGDVELDTSDDSDRVLVLTGIPGARGIYDRLRDAIDAARKTHGVVAVEATEAITGTRR